MVETAGTEQPQAAQESRPVRMGRLVVWGAVVLVLLFLALGLLNAFQSQPIDGAKAPDFTLQTYSGEQVTLSELRGQVVVINFWASWCVPCAEEAADLEAVWQAYKDDGVVFLGVGYVDGEQPALEFIERYGVTYPNGPDLGTRISDAYNITGVPETFIVNRQGEVVFFIAQPLSFERLSAEIEKALNS